MAKQETFNPQKLEKAEKEARRLETELAASPSAFSRNVAPQNQDLNFDAKLTKARNTIDQLKSQRLKEQWYGPEQAETEAPKEKEGLISRGLAALSAPLYAVTGGAEWALGKGSKTGLLENINANIKERETMGNLLQKAGAPKVVSLPLGFALDVFFDPVNWATAGTAAFIPRVAGGLVKGMTKGGLKTGLETAKVGAISGLQGKARAVMPWIAPMKTVGKIGEKIGADSALGKTLVKGAGKYRELTEGVGKKAIAGAEKYDTLMDKTVYDKLGKGIFGLSNLNEGKTLGATLENKIRQIPALGIGKMKVSGDDIMDFIKYSPTEHAAMTQLEDRVMNLAKSKGLLFVDPEKVKMGETVFETVDDAIKAKGAEAVKEIAQKQTKNLTEDALAAAENLTLVKNNLENAQRMLEIAGENYNLKHLTKAYEKTAVGKTGVKWYDNWLDKQKSKTAGGMLEKLNLSGVTKAMGIFDKVKDWRPVNTILNANDEYLKIFKWAKVPANPASHLNMVGGNVIMAFLAGLPINDPRLLRYVKENYQFLRGKRGLEFLRQNIFNDVNSWFDMLENDPIFFKSVFGFAPEAIVGKLPPGGKIPLKDVFKKFNPNLTLDDVVKEINRSAEIIAKNLDEAIEKAVQQKQTVEGVIAGREAALKNKPLPTGRQTIEKLMEQSREVPLYDLPSGWGGEIAGGKWLGGIEEWAAVNKDKNPAKWLADKMVNAMPKLYEYGDQAFKLGNTQFLTNVGLTEAGLLKLSRQVKIGREDLLPPVIEGGKKLYRLKPRKAAEASAEIYMNYAAMPDYVKILRSLPILGSPFFSFSAAMISKTGKTAVHNPAVFNKISFLLSEISGVRTPTEKAALEEKYNAFLNSPTVVRLSRNWNIDLKSMIPYLTLNMFNPSQRKYSETLPGAVANVIDSSPFMKHPLGQVMLDYLILPSILSEADRPQGQFGQFLYPIDASTGEKSLYALRSLAETAVPGAASYAGVTQPLLKGMGVPDEAINFYPSYGWRQIAEATQGKSNLGVLTKEDPAKKTLRALASRSGLPLYPLNTEFLTNKNQKKIK